MSQDEMLSSCGYSVISDSCAYVAPTAAYHHTAEQRARCDRAESVHQLAHLADDLICESLSYGQYRWANITGADVRLNRKLRGPCVQCVMGKMKQKHMSSSVSSPAANVGDMITFDLHALPVKSYGGNLNCLHSMDEFSGDIQITGTKGKSAVELFRAIMQLVYRRYNAHGHRVTHMMADSEPALLPVVAMLGEVGILLTFAPPGQHAQRIERVTGYSAGRKRAVLSSLPYYLPVEYELYSDAWISDITNANPTSQSRPSTADLIVTGSRRVENYKHPGLAFGATCLVTEFDDKRAHEAKMVSTSVVAVPKSELGVCLGLSPSTPGSYDFLLGNKIIVPRHVFEPVQVHPFGWKRRTVLTAELLPASVNGSPLAPPPSAVLQSSVQDVLTPSLHDPSDVPLEHVTLNAKSTALMPVPVTLDSDLPLAPDPDVRVPVPDDSLCMAPEDMRNLIRGHMGLAQPELDPVLPPPIIASPTIPIIAPPIIATPIAVPPVPPSPVSPVISSPPVSLTRGARKPSGFWHGSSARFAGVDYPSLWSADPDCVFDEFALLATGSPTLPSSDDPCRWAVSFDTQCDDELDLDQYLTFCSAHPSCVTESGVIDAAAFLAYAHSPISAASYVSRISSRLSSSVLLPKPSDKCKEVTLRKALRNGSDYLVDATATEIAKSKRLGAYGKVVACSDLPPGAIIVRAHVLYKLKHDGRKTCRIAIMGNLLAPKPSSETFASVVSDGAKMFSIAAMQAHTELRGEKLYICNKDVVGGFFAHSIAAWCCYVYVFAGKLASSVCR
jgi:hypothetical protein